MKSILTIILSAGLFFTLCCTSNDDFESGFDTIPISYLESGSMKITDFKGKILILDFWASWCHPCKKAVPVLEHLKKISDFEKVVFIGVNTDAKLNRKEVKNKGEEFGISYQIALDPEFKLATALKILGQPALVVFDKKGKLLIKKYGINDLDRPYLEFKIKQWEKL